MIVNSKKNVPFGKKQKGTQFQKVKLKLGKRAVLFGAKRGFNAEMAQEEINVLPKCLPKLFKIFPCEFHDKYSSI